MRFSNVMSKYHKKDYHEVKINVADRSNDIEKKLRKYIYSL